jgi:hypothetical protein
MILEHARIIISTARVNAYGEAFTKARPRVQGPPGGHSCCLPPKVGTPGEFPLLIEWESKVYPTEGFRRGAEYRAWSLLHPFYEVSPTVEYYKLVG